MMSAYEQWGHVIDSVPDLVAVIDRNHVFQCVNKAMADRLGSKPVDLIGRTCHKVVHRLSSSPDFCPISLMLKDGQTHSIEMCEKNMGGCYMVSVSPLYDDEGRLTAGVHVAVDISARKTAEERVRQLFQTLEARIGEQTARLLTKTAELDEANYALRVLLRQREKDRLEIEESVLLNIRVSLLPYLQRLKGTGQMSEEQLDYVEAIKNNLGALTSNFVRALSGGRFGLSPAEIRVAEMIRAGKGNKEIADSLCISQGTVRSHRERLRRKLGLTNQKVNLRTFVQSLPTENA